MVRSTHRKVESMKVNTQDNDKILEFIAAGKVTKLPLKKARGYVGKADLRKTATPKIKIARVRAEKHEVSIEDSKKIRIVSESNPRKEGTHGHANFAKYVDGMTVAEFRRVGLGMNHLRWDAEHGFIELV